jgi:hypothetical protein
MEKKSINNHTRLLSKRPQEQTADLSFPWGICLLIISLVFFLTWYFGYEYQSSWYWYFGVDINELNLPFYLFVEQGLVNLATYGFFLLFIFGAIYFVRLFLLFFSNLFFRKKKIEVSDLISIRNLYNRSVNLIPIVYFVLIEAFMYEVSTHNEIPQLFFDTPPNGMIYRMVSIVLGTILFIRLLSDLLVTLPVKWLRRLRLESKIKVFDETPRFILGLLLIIMTTLTFISITASGDASVGFRNNGSYQGLQHVNIESYFPIAGLASYRQGCDCNPYTYGSFGLVADNNGYLYLIPWKSKFSYPSSLYKIEQSSANTIYVVPYQTNQ